MAGVALTPGPSPVGRGGNFGFDVGCGWLGMVSGMDFRSFGFAQDDMVWWVALTPGPSPIGRGGSLVLGVALLAAAPCTGGLVGVRAVGSGGCNGCDGSYKCSVRAEDAVYPAVHPVDEVADRGEGATLGKALWFVLWVRGGQGVALVHHAGYAIQVMVGIEGTDDAPAVGSVAVGATPFQVGVQVHKGVETETIIGDVPDEGMGFGQGLTVSDGANPPEGEVFGDVVDAKDLEFESVLALEGVNAGADLGQGVYGWFLLWVLSFDGRGGLARVGRGWCQWGDVTCALGVIAGKDLRPFGRLRATLTCGLAGSAASRKAGFEPVVGQLGRV